MINFHYHVVSIIGIFIALAVGVVLRAGLLQNHVQVDVSSSATTSAAGPLLSTQADAGAAGLRVLTSSTLTGSLSSAKIVLVVLPGASDDDVAVIRSALTDVGMSAVGRVALADNWQSTSVNQYRTMLSTALASHLTSSAAKTASVGGVIGYLIVQVLTTTGAGADLLHQILTDKSTPIMTVGGDANGSAAALVAADPRTQATTASNATPAAVTSDPGAWIGLGRALGSTNGVLAGDVSTRAAMISQVRASDTVVTIVDSVRTALAAVDTALALSTPATGVHAFGVGTGTQSVIPSIK